MRDKLKQKVMESMIEQNQEHDIEKGAPQFKGIKCDNLGMLSYDSNRRQTQTK